MALDEASRSDEGARLVREILEDWCEKGKFGSGGPAPLPWLGL